MRKVIKSLLESLIESSSKSRLKSASKITFRGTKKSLARYFQVLPLIMTAFSGNAFAEKIGISRQDPPKYYLLAQSEEGDAYDPFVDFSEFEEASEEEADINFFRNGRFFTLGMVVGYRSFTDVLGDIYQPAPNFGLFLSYFFDLRFALQLTFLTGDHNIDFTSPAGNRPRGTASLTSFGLNIKYYFNTQNVTKGLAQINPYITGGFASISRTATVSSETAFSKESTNAFDIGLGIEVPILRNKMFVGLQTTYQLVSFANENSQIVLENGTDETGIFPTGDIINATVVLGVNF